MLTDYHVHLETGPYTLEWLNQYLKVAKQRGIQEIGFSEHGYRFKQSKEILLNPWIADRQTENIEEYINLVEKAKQEGLPVKLGIEMDYIPGKEKEIEKVLKRYPFDYVIGSVHWIGEWGFDLFEMREQWANQSIINVYQTYFNIISELLKSNLFDILGHVDVIKVFGHVPDDENREELTNIYDEVVKEIAKHQIAVEVSTAGLRKPVGKLYPDPVIMERIATSNTPILLNSDAHRPEHVGEDFDQGIAFIKQYNINETSIFTQRKRSMVQFG